MTTQRTITDISTHDRTDLVDVLVTQPDGTVTEQRYAGGPGGYLRVWRGNDYHQVFVRGRPGSGTGHAVDVPRARAGVSQRDALLAVVAFHLKAKVQR